MKQKLLFAVALLGILLGVVSAYVYGRKLPTQAPLAVSRDPYPSGIYAEGIIQSEQASGDDINVYPQVSGTATHVYVGPGQRAAQGAPLLAIDDAVQRRIVDADSAKISAALATLRYQQDQQAVLVKQATIDRRAVSRLALLTAADNVRIAEENLKVAVAARAADEALLREYVLRAPVAGTVLRNVATVGNYLSPQGVYDTYTQGYDPVVVMRSQSTGLQVKAYLDEILVPRLPTGGKLSAQMFIRGASEAGIALQFVRIDPYVTPKIELSNQRQEQVDTRVLPIIFRFTPTPGAPLYPGELVDVYIGANR
ncbi:MAG: efflux RND transporter periplasmic adaptor subunit [Steroidobacteraceae bacterium]